jgi:uncharacterized protein
LPGTIPDEWKLIFNPLWSPSEKEQADTNFVNQQANAAEVAMLNTLLMNSIISPEELRKIIVNKYGEYGFSDTLPSTGEDINYAEGVDVTDLQASEEDTNG